jgi:hypothetical protein
MTHPSSIEAPAEERRQFWDDLNARYFDAYSRLYAPFLPRKEAAAAAWTLIYGEHFEWIDWRETSPRPERAPTASGGAE